MTGSLVNHLMDRTQDPAPEVGMGATLLGWTDRHAATIVEVPNERTVVVQADTATRTDNNGMSDAQSYDYAANPDAPRVTYTLRKNGRWVRKGESSKNGARLSIGHRSSYYDYSF